MKSDLENVEFYVFDEGNDSWRKADVSWTEWMVIRKVLNKFVCG